MYNRAPTGGTCLTPAWVGIHDGDFDLYDRGARLPGFMVGLVEDGVPADVVAQFAGAAGTTVDTVLANTANDPPVICPGESVTAAVEHEVTGRQFFSYASMVIPSNDAFVANGDPQEHEIFNFFRFPVGASFTVPGAEVLDGGTEVNDEEMFSTAAAGQANNGDGADTPDGVVADHPGFIAGGRLLTDNPARDFTADGYTVLEMEVTSELIDEGISGFFGRLILGFLGIFF